MYIPKIYVDFHKMDDFGRLLLIGSGTIQDLEKYDIKLEEGLVLDFYSDDANDEGEPDELRVEGTVHYNEALKCWVAAIDWNAIRHASEMSNLELQE